MNHDLGVIRDCLRSVVILRSPLGIGSGFYVTNAGLIVTSRHVVDDLEVVTAQRHDRSERKVRVVRTGKNFDLALLWDESGDYPPPLPLAEPHEAAPGRSVFIIGHPARLEYTVTWGIVSATDRVLNGARFVQTDAVSHPGSSGGPLLDESGRVLGVVTMGMSAEGLNFALSAHYARELLGEMVLGPPGHAAAHAHGHPAPPAATPERRPAPSAPRNPVMAQVVRALGFLRPAPRIELERETALEFDWGDCPMTLELFEHSAEPHVAISAFVTALDESRPELGMRRALELNIARSMEAKLGLRGRELYATAERAVRGLDDPEVRAMVRRVAAIRAQFLSSGGE